MNNTRTLAIVAVLTAATLVVGVTFAAPITQSAFAGGKKDRQDKYMKGEQDSYKKDKQDKYVLKGKDKDKYMKGEQDSYKKGPPSLQDKNKTRDNGHDDGGNGNGNTVTVQVNKQKAYQSGWDNTQEQEAQNTICTHPSTNCVSEGSETPVNSTDTNSED